MNIRIISDVHSEFVDSYDRLLFTIPKLESDNNSVLVIAGDYCVLDKERFDTFKELSSRFLKVIYVTGNHEYYNGSFPYSEEKFNEFVLDNKLDNVHLLQNDHLVIDDVTIYGSTLWTNYGNSIPAAFLATQSMNDYRKIRTGSSVLSKYERRFTTDDCYDHFIKSIRTLKKLIGELPDNQKLLVVTHCAPCELSISEEFKGDPLNVAFYSELFFNDKYLNSDERLRINVWIHGHVHHSVDYVVDDTRIICNPAGYPNQDTSFDRFKLIEL